MIIKPSNIHRCLHCSQVTLLNLFLKVFVLKNYDHTLENGLEYFA